MFVRQKTVIKVIEMEKLLLHAGRQLNMKYDWSNEMGLNVFGSFTVRRVGLQLNEEAREMLD